jgi:hypothetical protein
VCCLSQRWFFIPFHSATLKRSRFCGFKWGIDSSRLNLAGALIGKEEDEYPSFHSFLEAVIYKVTKSPRVHKPTPM